MVTWYLYQMNKSLPSLSQVLIKKTLPKQVGLQLGLFLVFFIALVFYSYRQINELHKSQSLAFNQHIEQNLILVKQQLDNIASNDLVVNSIIDYDQRNTYLPLLFQSLRINNTKDFSIAFVDFTGEVITERNYSSQLKQLYLDELVSITIEAKAHYKIIDKRGVFISVPVLLNDYAEGAIVFHTKTLEKVIPNFDSGISMQAVSAGEVLLTSYSGDIVHEESKQFERAFLYKDWQIESTQSYFSAYKQLAAGAIFMFCAVMLSIFGCYIASRLAANESQIILRRFSLQLRALATRTEIPDSENIVESNEIAAIYSTFEHTLDRLTEVSKATSQLNLIFNGVKECLILLDANNDIVMTNSTVDSLLEQTDFDEQTITEIIESLVITDSELSIQIQSTVEHQYVIADTQAHEVILWYSSKIKTDDGGFVHILVGQNISEKRRAEEELLIKSSAVDKANTSIIISDVSHKDQPIIYANQAYSDLTGYEKSDVLGKNCNLLQGIKTEPEKVERIRKAIALRKPLTLTLINYKANGKPFSNRLMLSPVKQPNGDVRYYVGIQQDVSKQVAAQTLLEDAKQKAEESNKLKSDFLASMSHEIRTPINGISGTLQLLDKTQLDQRQSKFVSLAIRSTDNLLTIINDILDFSKIEAGKLSIEKYELNIEELVRTSSDGFYALAAEKNLNLNVHVDLNDEVYILGDGVRLRQILDNLISNAIKFTNKGDIFITLGWQPNYNGKYAICFSVSDSGVGIAKEQLNRVFEHFVQEDASTTRKFGGSGLGLAICKQLCELMNGEISVESEKGQGTTFRVTIPTTIVQKRVVSSHIETQAFVDESAYKDCTVLIVEDNELNRIIASEQLNQFKLFNAENGKQAIQLLNNKNSNIDVILMDCQMPVMDGYDATQAIRTGKAGERYRDIPIIALTANAMKGDREKCLEAGMNDYLSKPFKAESLIFAVKTWYEKSIS